MKMLVGEVSVEKAHVINSSHSPLAVGAQVESVHHYAALCTSVTAVYMFTVIRLSASHLSKLIATISGIPHPGISFEV